ncbi:MAG: energy transducer TonB [Saprospiraceae bacterium]|nr:energy transducer TonB [Saprospiraceae bacterium]
MKKEKRDKHFIHQPSYEGGLKALRAFISKNQQYPEKALQKKIEGTVYLKYTIDNKGDVVDTRIIKSLGDECDQEAIRIVKLLKFQVPKNKGIRVLFHKSIQIHFRLPKEKPVAPSTELVYTVTSAPNKVKAPEKESGGGYTILLPHS